MSGNLRIGVLSAAGVGIVAAGICLLTAYSHSQVIKGEILRPPIQIEVGDPNVTVAIPSGSPPVQVGPNAAGTTVTFPDGAVQLPGPDDSVTVDLPKGGTFVVSPGKKRAVAVTGPAASVHTVKKHIGKPKYD